jgi:hypothetical protein
LYDFPEATLKGAKPKNHEDVSKKAAKRAASLEDLI